MGGRNSPAHLGLPDEVPQVAEPVAANGELLLTLNATGPVRFHSIRWASSDLSVPVNEVRSWFVDEPTQGNGPLHVEGSVDEKNLPIAIMIELDLRDQPTQETIRWIGSSPFSIRLYPAAVRTGTGESEK
jgi:hypothetical protein